MRVFELTSRAVFILPVLLGRDGLISLGQD